MCAFFDFIVFLAISCCIIFFLWGNLQPQTTLMERIQVLYFVLSLIPSSFHSFSFFSFSSGFIRSYQHFFS